MYLIFFFIRHGKLYSGQSFLSVHQKKSCNGEVTDINWLLLMQMNRYLHFENQILYNSDCLLQFGYFRFMLLKLLILIREKFARSKRGKKYILEMYEGR